MENACKYLKDKILSWESSSVIVSSCLVSFSSVNDDMRQVFRKHFKNSHWCLYDTPSNVAEDRIAKRQGHFYKGAPETESVNKGSEWEFEDVGFDHRRIDGTANLDKNADLLAGLLREMANQ